MRREPTIRIMAINMTEAVQKGMEALVNCSICTEPYKEPKVLPCQHTFCLRCLHQFFDCYNQQRIIKMTNFPCPACRKIVYLSQGGMSALPNDFKVGQIQDFLGKVGIASKSRSDICDICKYDKKQKDASHFCVQCSKYLCQQCMNPHQENSLFQTHSVMSVEATDVSVLECKEHNEEIKYFCVPCSLPLCTVCALGKHSKHDTINVTTALDQKRHIIENMLADARQMTQKFEDKAQELQGLKQSREIHYANTQADVKKHVEEIIEDVRDQESELLKKLERKHNEAMKLIQKDAEQIKMQSTDMMSWIDSSNELLNPTKSLQLLAAQQHLIAKMDKLLQTPLPCAAARVTEGPKFQPGSLNSIGELTTVALTEEQAQVKEAAIKENSASEVQAETQPSFSETANKASKPEPSKKVSEMLHSGQPCSRKAAEGPASESQSGQSSSPTRQPSSQTRLLSSPTRPPASPAERPLSPTRRPPPPSPTSPGGHTARRMSTPPGGQDGRYKSPLTTVRENSPTKFPGTSPSRTPLSSRGEASGGTPLSPPTGRPEKRPPLLGRSTSMRDISTRSPTAREQKAASTLRSSKKIILQRSQPLKHTAKLSWRTDEYSGTRGVAFTGDGLIVTAEHEDGSDKIELFDSSGEIKKWMMSGSCSVVKPWGVAVNNQTSAIIVTDHGDSSVKVLDQDLTVTNIWRLHFSKPCGVAVMRTGDYVVSDIGDRAFKVSIHTPSGLRVQEFGAHGMSDGHLLRPQYVAIDHHDRILVSDCDANCIKIFDRHGKQLSKFSNTDDSRLNMFPQGVCVDASNHILVADQSYSGVSMYSPDGKFIQHIVKLDNPPWDVAVYETGFMAIGTDPSLRLYLVPTLAHNS